MPAARRHPDEREHPAEPSPARYVRLMSSWRDRDAPWQLTYLNRLDDFLRGDINDRDIVGDAVGHEQIPFVRCECHVPDPLADQEIFGHGVARRIDHGD